MDAALLVVRLLESVPEDMHAQGVMSAQGVLDSYSTLVRCGPPVETPAAVAVAAVRHLCAARLCIVTTSQHAPPHAGLGLRVDPGLQRQRSSQPAHAAAVIAAVCNWPAAFMEVRRWAWNSVARRSRCSRRLTLARAPLACGAWRYVCVCLQGVGGSCSEPRGDDS